MIVALFLAYSRLMLWVLPRLGVRTRFDDDFESRHTAVTTSPLNYP